jgi:hypothetical protein
LSPRRNGGDEAVLNKQERILDLFLRRIETISAEDDHIPFEQVALDHIAIDHGASSV